MMPLSDLMRISVRQVIRLRKNYLGVTLSIAFGVAGLIVISVMGREVKANLNNDLELLGGATVIKAEFDSSALNEELLREPPYFRDPTIAKLRKIPGVTGVSASIEKIFSTSMDDRIVGFTLRATDVEYWRIFNYLPVEGRFFTDEESMRGANVAVIGARLAQRIFGEEETALGRNFPVEGTLVTVVGVLEEGKAQHRADWAFVPLKAAQMRFPGAGKANTLYVQCATWNDVGPAAAEVERIVAENQPSQGLKLTVAWKALEQVKRVARWVEIFIYLAVAAGLGLGGFGIWNGMMVAVKSRTREIGIKKAIGAVDIDIMIQFLTEAVLIGAIGAVIGIATARLGVVLIESLLAAKLSEQLFLLYSALSLGFSLVLGALAGLLPALRAGSMDPVSAMRPD